MKKDKKRIVKKILFGVSIVGIIGTAVVSAYDTYQAMQKLNTEEVDKSNTKEVIKSAAPCYIRTAAVATVTLGCAIANEKMNIKTIAELTAVASSLGYTVNKYREKIKEYASPEVLKNIDMAVAKDKGRDRYARQIVTDNGEKMFFKDEEVRFHDRLTDTWWVGTPLAYSTARYLVNQQFAWGSQIPLEMFYNLQGVCLPNEFEDYKWDWIDFNDGVLFIGINHERKKDKNGEYWEITYDQDPMLGEA